MFDSMVDALCRGEGIEIRGFGSFSIRAYKEYQGRNPRTGEAVHVRPKRLAFFKVGKELRERVNNGRTEPVRKPPTSSSSGSSDPGPSSTASL
jgi:integration host factor subunit beta